MDYSGGTWSVGTAGNRPIPHPGGEWDIGAYQFNADASGPSKWPDYWDYYVLPLNDENTTEYATTKSTGWFYPQTATQSGLWNDEGNAADTYTNSTYATIDASDTHPEQMKINLTNFGFDGVGGVPSGSYINGIKGEICCKVNSGEATIPVNLLYLDSPVIAEPFVTQPASSITQTADVIISFGSDTDLASSVITDTIVRSSSFGIQIAIPGSETATVLSVKWARIKVYYSYLAYTSPGWVDSTADPDFAALISADDPDWLSTDKYMSLTTGQTGEVWFNLKDWQRHLQDDPTVWDYWDWPTSWKSASGLTTANWTMGRVVVQMLYKSTTGDGYLIAQLHPGSSPRESANFPLIPANTLINGVSVALAKGKTIRQMNAATLGILGSAGTGTLTVYGVHIKCYPPTSISDKKIGKRQFEETRSLWRNL